jgi:hypothetical protein
MVEYGIKQGRVEEAFEEGQDPHRAVESVTIMMMRSDGCLSSEYKINHIIEESRQVCNSCIKKDGMTIRMLTNRGCEENTHCMILVPSLNTMLFLKQIYNFFNGLNFEIYCAM